MSEVWRSILTPDAPCWVAFEADHCVLLPEPGPFPAAEAQRYLRQAPSDGEVAEHEQGYLFITSNVFTLVRPSEVQSPGDVPEVALQKRRNSTVTHVELHVPIEGLSRLILKQAAADQVEAVTLEPTAQGGEIRFLKQGVWSTVMQPPVGVVPQLIRYWQPRGLQLSQGPWGECATLALPSSG